MVEIMLLVGDWRGVGCRSRKDISAVTVTSAVFIVAVAVAVVINIVSSVYVSTLRSQRRRHC